MKIASSLTFAVALCGSIVDSAKPNVQKLTNIDDINNIKQRLLKHRPQADNSKPRPHNKHRPSGNSAPRLPSASKHHPESKEETVTVTTETVTTKTVDVVTKPESNIRGGVTEPQEEVTEPQGEETEPQEEVAEPQGEATEPQKEELEPQGGSPDYAACDSDEFEFTLNMLTDNSAKKDNIIHLVSWFGSDEIWDQEELQDETRYLETLCLPDDECWFFGIADDDVDGFKDGYVEVFVDGILELEEDEDFYTSVLLIGDSCPSIDLLDDDWADF